MGAIGYLCKYWLMYHIVYASMAVLLSVMLAVLTDESARWLVIHIRLHKLSMIVYHTCNNGILSTKVRSTKQWA